MMVQIERFDDVAAEVLPLAQAHWDEVEAPMYGARTCRPDPEHYQNAEAAGVLTLFTARHEGRLVGYASFFSVWNPHLGGICAMLDALFLVPEQRGFSGMALLRHAQQALLEGGAVAVQYVSPASRDCGALYRRLGAVATETVYTVCNASAGRV